MPRDGLLDIVTKGLRDKMTEPDPPTLEQLSLRYTQAVEASRKAWERYANARDRADSYLQSYNEAVAEEDAVYAQWKAHDEQRREERRARQP